MKKTTPLILIAIAFLTGCTFSQRTQIAWLDSDYAPKTGGNLFDRDQSAKLLSQPVKSKPQVFLNSTVPARHYRAIAIMSVDGNPNEEPTAVQAFINLSSRAGADAVLIERAANGQAGASSQATATNSTGSAAGGNGSSSAYVLLPNVRCVFRATAVVWTP